MKYSSLLALSLMLPMLTGCDNSAGSQTKKLLSFFEDNKIGTNGDYGVFKSNALVQGVPVVAVFGFYDNSKECQAIADRYNRDEPDTYQCRALNK